MSTVSSSLKLFDSMSGPLKSITQAMNLMLSTMNQMQNATNKNVNVDKAFMAAKRQVAAAETEIKKAIDQSTEAQNKYNRSVRESTGLASNLVDKLKGVGAAYIIAQAAKKGMEISDEYTSTQARLNLISGGNTKGLQGQIFSAASAARGDYGTMANSVGKLGLLAGEAFSNNNELVKFTELMQKSFKISGASTQEQQSGMYQLTQAMAAGKLQGDEFRSIMENAPMLAAAIAKYTGKSKGELKEMSSEGTITAGIIKGAMFAAAEDINNKFSSMPKTFGETAIQFKNTLLQAFAPLLENMNRLLNSQVFVSFLNNVTTAIYLFAGAVNSIMSVFSWLGSAIQNTWPLIEPILVMIGAALMAWAVTQIPLLATKIAILIGQLWGMVTPILAQAAAWMIANWPILLVGAAIGFLLYAMLKFGDAVIEVVGFVGGLFGTLFAFLFNKFAFFGNMILSVAEFFINVWKDPVYAVKKLFYDLVINALQYLQNLAKGIENVINKIPGLKVDITSGMDGLLKNLEDARDSLKSEDDVVKLMRFEQIDYGDAFNKGQDIGKTAGKFAVDGVQNVFGALGNMLDFSKFGASKAPEIPNIDKVNEVGKINDKVDISSEDLKTMRELAEMKNIQNFVTLTPTVSINTGDITQGGFDIDTVVARITETLETQIASSAEGVYV